MKKNKRLIAKIFNGEEVVMTIDRNMLSCEFGALDRGNLTDVVNWGIYANRGSISFIDNIGYFNSQNVNSTDIKKCIVKFYLAKNLAKNQETLIATFKVDTVDFDDETRRVDIQLVGRLIDWQSKPSSINVPEGETGDVFPFDSKTIEYLAGFSPPTTGAEANHYEDYYPNYNLSKGNTVTNLSTNIYCPYLQYGTIWDRMTKICQASMCRIFEGKDGYPVIDGERKSVVPIYVMPKNIISISKSYFVKIENPSIEVIERKKHQYVPSTEEDTRIRLVNRLYINYSSETNTEGELVREYPMSISGADFNINENIKGSEYEYLLNKLSYELNTQKKTKSIANSRYFYGTKTLNGESKDYSSGATSYMVASLRNYEKVDVKLRSGYSFRIYYDYAGLTEKDKYIEDTILLTCFEDEQTKLLTKITTDAEENDIISYTTIDSNDLIQSSSHYNGEPLGEHILKETIRRYATGRECFEIECLFNDYYDIQGEKAFSKDDLSDHFEKYDIIVPYVMKKGKAVPLRVNEDETPKQFRIIGISYSYDGLLKQKLSVQEEVYDRDLA